MESYWLNQHWLRGRSEGIAGTKAVGPVHVVLGEGVGWFTELGGIVCCRRWEGMRNWDRIAKGLNFCNVVSIEDEAKEF